MGRWLISTVRLINRPELHSAETHAEELPRVYIVFKCYTQVLLCLSAEKRRRRQFLESYQKKKKKVGEKKWKKKISEDRNKIVERRIYIEREKKSEERWDVFNPLPYYLNSSSACHKQQ